MSGEVLLKAEHLSKEFPASGGVVSAVCDVNLEIYKGETLSLVGESGCGKSTLGKLLLHLLEPTDGKVIFEGTDLSSISTKQLREIRQRMQIIYQDPFSSLDPRMKIGDIIAEPLKIHKLYPDKKQMRQRVEELMDRVGIRKAYYSRYPHQFSGGQRQRIGIARALSVNPQLVVCDEPVSALDVSIQAQVLNLLKDLQEEMGLTYLFVSHDLSVVRYISDRVCVMFLGRMCEIGPADQIYEKPLHPYTRFLLDSVPEPDPEKRKEDRPLLEGEMPSPMAPPKGCRFHTRCPRAQQVCMQDPPPAMVEMAPGRCCACHFPLSEDQN